MDKEEINELDDFIKALNAANALVERICNKDKEIEDRKDE